MTAPRRWRQLVAVALAPLILLGTAAAGSAETRADEPTGHITGTVTGPDGDGLSCVEVYVIEAGPYGYYLIDNAGTDAHGDYDVSGLRAGTFRLEFLDRCGRGYASEYWDNAPTLALSTAVVVPTGATVSGKNAQLNPPTAITNDLQPEIFGVAKVGSELEASVGHWNPASGLDFAVHWFADGTPIPTVTSSYTPVPADVGKTIVLEVTASLAGYPDVAATSEGVVVGPGIITATTDPEVRGKARRGATIVVKTGDWDPDDTTVSVQWFAGKKAIADATSTRLKLTGKAATAVTGKRISVTVTVTAPGYLPTSATVTVPGKVRKK